MDKSGNSLSTFKITETTAEAASNSSRRYVYLSDSGAAYSGDNPSKAKFVYSSGLKFDPSTNTLITTNFDGNATSATNATRATTAIQSEKSKMTWISSTNYTELAKAGLYCVIFRFSQDGDEYSFTVYKPASGSSAICVVGCQWKQTIGKYLDGYWGVAWLHYGYKSGSGYVSSLSVSMVQIDQATGKITAVKTEANVDYSWIYRIETY